MAISVKVLCALLVSSLLASFVPRAEPVVFAELTIDPIAVGPGYALAEIDGDDPLMPAKMRLAHAQRQPVTCTANSSTALQNCINSSAGGDTINLASVSFPVDGSFRLPRRPSSDNTDVVIKGSNPAPSVLSNAYPNSYHRGSFTRLTPAMTAKMPKLVGVSTLGTPVLQFLEGSHHWRFEGLEITTDGKYLTPALVSSSHADIHHITFDQNFLHPQEEVGELTTNIAVRSTESAFIVSGHHWTWTRNAIQGFTGHAPAANGSYRLNANSILVGYIADSLIENNLLEANGQIFLSGGGGVDPAHQAKATNITYTSATFSNTKDLDVGDYFAIYSRALHENHRLPHTGSPNVIVEGEGHYANGRILTVNHQTGAVTFTHLTSGLDYRTVNLNLWGATGGTYTLTFQGRTTGPLPWNASYAEIAAALVTLGNLAPNQFIVGEGIYAPIVIRIGRNRQGQPVGPWLFPTPLALDSDYGSPLSVNGANLTGGIRSASATIKTGESFRPLEGTPSNPLADAPDSGADVRWEGTQSHDVMIRRNIIAHHREWTAVTGSVKGFAEVKGGDHVTFDGNIFSGEGTTIIWTARNQGDGGSSPWSDVSYSKVTNNIFDTTGYTNAFALEDGAHENSISHDILLSNNLFVNPDMGQSNPWIRLQSGYNVTITHNTVFACNDLIYGVSYVPSRSPVIKDNIFRPGRYPSPCVDGPGPCWPGNVASNNLIVNNLGINRSLIDGFFSTFGANAGWIENSLAAVGFTNPSPNLDLSGDYRLKPGSRYKAGGTRQASDGKDLGVDFAELIAALGFDPFTGGAALPAATPSPAAIPAPSPAPVRPRRVTPISN